MQDNGESASSSEMYRNVQSRVETQPNTLSREPGTTGAPSGHADGFSPLTTVC